MNIGERGIKLIKEFEQCRLRAYKPTPEDVWTCGWGSTEGVTEDTVWSQEEADEAFLKDAARFEKCVNEAVTVPMTQNEFDACVSLAFNIGCAAFRKSTLVRKLNDSDYDGAALEFRRWDKQSGRVLAGLTRRRLAEERLFEA